MLNILKAEFLKLKKDTMFGVGTILSILLPVFLVIKDKFLASPPGSITDWVMTCQLIDCVVLSAISGFILTNLVQKEYQAGTLKNIFSAGISRGAFLFSKLAVWFVWYVIMLAFMELVAVAGSRWIYPSQFDEKFAGNVIVMFTKFGLLAFLTLLPLLWIAIRQKKLFYPAILLAIGFSGILMSGVSISMEMMLPACILPWTAVSMTAIYQVQGVYSAIGLVSVFLTGIIGLALAMREIYRQDH